MEVEVAASERETIMACIWEKCQRAWAADEVERAKNLHKMYDLLDGMTDEEYLDAHFCECINCPCDE